MSRREQTRAQRSRLRVLEAALERFAAKGFEATTFQEVASKAGVSVGLACRYFPTKEHLALALYTRLADDLEAWAAAEMPAGTVAARFDATMQTKLALLAPHKKALAALAARALDPEGRAAVLGPGTEVVRSTVAGVFALVVRGATDSPGPDQAASLARVLYAAHLALVLLYVQDGGDGKLAREALDLAKTGIATFAPMLPLAAASPIGARLDALLSALFGTSKLAAPGETARIVCERIFRRRRVLADVAREPGEAALSLHLPRVQGFVDAAEPVLLVLPAFPAKAPNPHKVLGTRPDTAEWLALESLAGLLDEIGEAHTPGAELVICSDGGVFADAVGVADRDVAAYRADLAAMIAELGVKRGAIRIWGLEDAFGDVGPTAARKLLMMRWAPSLDEIRERAKRSASAAAQLDGIHRFLFEDELALRAGVSRTQARKTTRERAYEVVRRSEAWGRLVSAAFPGAVRLSIHPQADVSEKIGIHLLPTEDAWLTPWHGVAVLEGERFRLMRRKDAAELGARVVEEDGRPSHMEVSP